MLFLVSLTCLFGPSLQVRYVRGNNDADGNPTYLKDARKPALFTRTFGDCLGSSVVNVTRFDAAYYKDNMTVLFHLQGSTDVVSESLMSMPSRPGQEARECQLTVLQCTLVSSHVRRIAPVDGVCVALRN